jgi:hypothetical protein
MPNKLKVTVDTTNKTSSKKKNKKQKSKNVFVEKIVTEDNKSVDTQVTKSKTKNKKNKTVEVIKNVFKSVPKDGGKKIKERTRKRLVTRFTKGGSLNQYD